MKPPAAHGGKPRSGRNAGAQPGDDKAVSRYYVREIERDWQPIEAENVEAAAERYVAEYTEPADGSNYWIDLVVRGPEGEFFFPRTARGAGGW